MDITQPMRKKERTFKLGQMLEKGIKLLNPSKNPEQYAVSTFDMIMKTQATAREGGIGYSLKNPSPSYKLTGVPVHPIPSPRAFPLGVVIPRRAELGVGGIR